ncbi:MAG: transketolase family protein [Proteobacteria bacterium]|nr:transketolase family protein [Pseudomonadota bacterium]
MINSSDSVTSGPETAAACAAAPPARATRDAFGETLQQLGSEHPQIVVLDADLSESTRSAMFAAAFPERFFQLGIQEANMLGTAAGLAATGKRVFCCSFSCFVTGRFDQIKVSVAYNDVPVTIVGTHSGCAVGPDGYTQMALEDIALLRTLPNMLVLQPADDLETVQMVEHLVTRHSGPAFLRLTRQKVPRLHDQRYRFVPGAVDRLRVGRELAICATGACVAGALEAAVRLEREGCSATVLNVPTLAPLDGASLAAALEGCDRVLSVEDHSVIGGLGSAICEALAERRPTHVRRVGLREFGESGATEALFSKHHLDGPGIYAEAKALLATRAG